VGMTHLAQAKVSTRFQISLPAIIRKELGVDEGDYVIFSKQDGRIVISGGAVQPKSRL